MIVDGHLDLAYNAVNFGRELRHPVDRIRAAEVGRPTPAGVATVSIPALLDGGVGLALGSLFVMPASMQRVKYRSRIVYDDSLPPAEAQADAERVANVQLDYYHRLADNDERIVLVREWADVESVQARRTGDEPALGIMITMEGAAPIREPETIEAWYARGVRGVGLAWDDTPYAPGQWRGNERLTPAGRALLAQMARFSMLVDVTHMAERATFDVFETYDGPIAATHCNARRLVPGDRQLTDAQIRAVAEKGGVIGVVLFNQFLTPNYVSGRPRREVDLSHVMAQVDHICQLLGTAEHVGFGSDWDGGFGAADIPAPLDSAADWPRVAEALADYGFSAADIDRILGDNWLRLLRRVLHAA